MLPTQFDSTYKAMCPPVVDDLHVPLIHCSSGNEPKQQIDMTTFENVLNILAPKYQRITISIRKIKGTRSLTI